MKALAIDMAPTMSDASQPLRRLALMSAAALALLITPVGAQTTAPAPAQPASGQPAPSTPPATPPANPPAATTPPAPSGQAAQPGVRAVNPATLKVTFYTVQPADMLSSNLVGLDVHNLQNEEIGEIEDLVLDNGKTIRGLVIGVGGFLGIGERRTVVEPASMVVTREAGGSLKAVVNTTREDLKNAPEFKFEGNMSRRK